MMSYYELSGKGLPHGAMAAWLLEAEGATVWVDVGKEWSAIIELGDETPEQAAFLIRWGTEVEEVDLDDYDDSMFCIVGGFGPEEEMLADLNKVGGELVSSWPWGAITEREFPQNKSEVAFGTICDFVADHTNYLKPGWDFDTYCIANFQSDGYIYSVDDDKNPAVWFGIMLHTVAAETAWAAMKRGDTWEPDQDEAEDEEQAA